MTHANYTSASILPPAPKGLKVRTRHITGHNCRQSFGAGGFFEGWKKGTTGMTQADLAKVCAITIDVDAYDWEGSAPRWGEDRSARKAAMRAATEDEVVQWMEAVSFRDVVAGECAAVGLPPVPNRVVYTGHGLCLLYFVGDSIGWKDAEKNEGHWTPAAIKQVIKRFHGHNKDLWWWDSCAKDVGTRLFPLPGGKHRDTGKSVRLIDTCDDAYDIKGWLDDLAKQYPGNPAPKKRVRKVSAGREPSGPGTPGTWTTCIHNPADHPVLEIGEKGDACPLCGGSGYKRLCEEHYSCFSCSTQFKVIPEVRQDPVFTVASLEAPDAPEPPGDPPGYVRLNDEGHALWPEDTPVRLVNMARTGTGKTHLMEREKKKWCPRNLFHKRVIAVAPTIALAGNLADRLGVAHGEAGTKVDWRSGSFACCFASLVSKTYGLAGPHLRAAYIMLDECETTLSQLVGLLSNGEKARETYNTLVHLCAGAGKVMLADANAGPVTRRFIEDVKEQQEKHAQMEVLEWDVWYTDAHKHTFEYVSPLTRLTQTGEEVLVRSSDHMHKGRLLEAIEAGKKVAVYVPGNAAAKGLAATIERLFPALNIQLRVRNNSNDQKNDLTQSGLTADVLIYNNSMNTGVSYDVKDHYDEVHLLLGRGHVTDSVHVEQAVHRIRHPKSKVFVISGSLTPAISDGRCSPEWQLAEAARRLQAGERVTTSMKAGVSLASDWMWEASSQRLAAVQATVVASRYARGYRWTITHLAAHHNFVTAQGEDNVDFAREIRETRDAIERREAAEVASAVPLSDFRMAEVETQGPATEGEYHSFRNAKLGQMYGEGFAAQDVDEKAAIAFETKRKRLAQKTRVFALSRLMDTDANKQLAAEAEVRLNSRTTVMTVKVNLPAARILDACFNAIVTHCQQDDGRWDIDTRQARKVINAASPLMEAAGLRLRVDAYTNPFQQIQTLLKLGGLKLRSRKVGPREDRTRVYWLAVPDVERMLRLSDAYIERWKAHGKEEEAELQAG